jgi:hypothetical protein
MDVNLRIELCLVVRPACLAGHTLTPNFRLTRYCYGTIKGEARRPGHLKQRQPSQGCSGFTGLGGAIVGRFGWNGKRNELIDSIGILGVTSTEPSTPHG